jgi:glutamate-1-semialdehyde 2,1-aminomutase
MDKQKGYERLEEIGQMMETAVLNTLRSKGLNYRWYRRGSMFCLFFTEQEVHQLSDAKTADLEAFRKFFTFCLDKGVYFAPSQFETGFISLAHSRDDMAQTAEVVAAALAQL